MAHGHHDQSADMKKAVAMALVLIVGFVAGAYFLAKRGLEARKKAGHPIHIKSQIDNRGSEHRLSFVATFVKRQSRLGFKFQASAAGADLRTFRVSWAGKANPRKAANLKVARPLHDELGRLGFKEIAIYAGGQKTWSKTL